MNAGWGLKYLPSNFTPALGVPPETEFEPIGNELEEALDPTPEMENALKTATEEAEKGEGGPEGVEGEGDGEGEAEQGPEEDTAED